MGFMPIILLSWLTLSGLLLMANTHNHALGTQNSTTFAELSRTYAEESLNKGDPICSIVSLILSDKKKVERFKSRIRAVESGSILQRFVELNPSALRCFLNSCPVDTRMSPSRQPGRPLFGPNCIWRAYTVFNGNRSSARFLFVFMKRDLDAELGPKGPERQPVSGDIQVASARASRDEVIRTAIRKLIPSRSFSDSFVDRFASVVTKVGPRRYRVILRFKKNFF